MGELLNKKMCSFSKQYVIDLSSGIILNMFDNKGEQSLLYLPFFV
jgi:hypothetical protein